ncbi:GM18933 [Drosophila sechellia]|uniref:GM18933 n=1 Tax=Drosophila sechellia TaxID=7238 RepID=B4I9L8_DROSE|nr:GM18933 [Drosophila sechellia]
MALTFTVNTYRVLIRSFLAAIVPLYSMLCMAHPNSFLLCVTVGLYFLGPLPYVVRLQYGFNVLAKDTWFAYNDQVLATADTFNTWRVLIYLNQAHSSWFC